MLKPGRVALAWGLWIGAGLVLDLAAWSALRTVPILAADPPGSAGVIALIAINGFILPPLFADTDRRMRRVLFGLGVALFAVPVAMVVGFVAASLPLSTMIALSPPVDDYPARMSIGPVMRGVFVMLEAVMVAAPALGGATAALVIGGIAAAVPGLCRPRVSWRLATAGAWSASVLILPSWQISGFGDWSTPALLLAAALPPLVLVSWRDMLGRPLALAAPLVAIVLFGSGAVAAATIDPRPDPQACSLLNVMDLEPLLLAGAGGAIDSEDHHPAPGLATCRWLGRPQDHAADAVPRAVTLAFYHLADVATAREQMDRQPHQETRASLAIGGEGDDAVVRPSSTIVVARHGADIAVIDASGADLSDPDQIEARYLLDAVALKAAGATVEPPPWAEPGQVATLVPLAPTGSIAGWTPPPHAAAAGADLLEPAIHAIKALASRQFGLTAVLLPASLMLLLVPHARRLTRIAGSMLTLLIVANTLFGESIAVALIDRYGATGAATVTGSFATSTQYNRHDVIGYRVLIGTTGRKTVAGEFRCDDFNVRGLVDTSIYPETGDVFTVRYLAHHPQDFTIRNDDQSPWARKLACARLGAWRAEAQRRSGAVPGDAGVGRELENAMAAEQAAGCPR